MTLTWKFSKSIISKNVKNVKPICYKLEEFGNIFEERAFYIGKLYLGTYLIFFQRIVYVQSFVEKLLSFAEIEGANREKKLCLSFLK